MNASLHYVAYSAVLTWLMLYLAAILRTRAWTVRGLRIAFGNRENMAHISPLAFRADQTAQNTLEGFILFAALITTVHLADVNNAQTEVGAALFFWARVVYIPTYLIGVAYLRTAIWLVSVVGLGMIAAPLFGL